MLDLAQTSEDPLTAIANSKLGALCGSQTLLVTAPVQPELPQAMTELSFGDMLNSDLDQTILIMYCWLIQG